MNIDISFGEKTAMLGNLAANCHVQAHEQRYTLRVTLQAIYLAENKQFSVIVSMFGGVIGKAIQNYRELAVVGLHLIFEMSTYINYITGLRSFKDRACDI